MGGIISGTILFVVILFGAAYWSCSATCRAQGAAMGVPASYGLLTDCMIEIDGRMIPLTSYKVVKVAP